MAHLLVGMVANGSLPERQELRTVANPAVPPRANPLLGPRLTRPAGPWQTNRP
jgi:hypothetical protein